jgi:HAD superfamily hydrolase (TIGR01509 family)
VDVGDAGVEAVLFDSGGVLVGPVGGRWNPRFDFEEILAKRVPHVGPNLIATAIRIGDEFLDSAAGTPSREDYHRVLLDTLGVRATPELLVELDAPLDPTAVVEPYPEVVEVLDELRSRRIRLAVVSDAWPSLPTLHDGVGLAGYFEAYAISAVLGCTKPDARMYRHASDSLGIAPDRCLFVDDQPHLVAAALELGYHGCAVLRDGVVHPEIPSVSDLSGLLQLIE